MNNEAVKTCGRALRVIPAETRLTVYRRRPVREHCRASSISKFCGSLRFLRSVSQNGEAKYQVKSSSFSHNQTRACELSYGNNEKYNFYDVKL